MACWVYWAVASPVMVPSALGSGEDVEPEVAAASRLRKASSNAYSAR